MYSSHYQPSRIQQIWFVLFAVVLVPVLFHFLYSFLGFNPTDEGTVLALSRRILNGQLPHRDFISIRPVGSALFHIPDLILGGDSAFWLSRFVCWFQLSVITLCWLFVMEYSTHTKFSWLEKLSIFMIGFYLSVHSFPMMAWTTIDGLFFSSIGTFLILKKSFLKQLGYFFLGFAIICKQVFLPYGFICLFILKDYRRIGSWLYLILPVTLYLEWIISGHGWPSLLLQLGTRSELLLVGFSSYFTHYPIYLGLIVGLASLIINIAKSWEKQIAQLYYYLTILLALAIIFAIWWHNSYVSPYQVIFGVALGHAIALLIEKEYNQLSLVLLAVSLAWCSSISLGYPTPALAGSILFFSIYSFSRMKLGLYFAHSIQFLLLTLAAICTYLFVEIREKHIYREVTEVEKIHYHLGDFLYGFNHIYTNARTYDALHDLRLITDKLDPAKFAIITDYPAWWSTSIQSNLLSIDWSQRQELYSDTLFNQTWKELQSPDIHFIIAQRYYTDSLAYKLIPVDKNKFDFMLLDSVRLKYALVKQTRYFNLYSKPFVSYQEREN